MNFTSVQSFFPIMLLALSIGGILFIVLRNRGKMFGNFPFIIQAGTSSLKTLLRGLSFLGSFAQKLAKAAHAYSFSKLLGRVRNGAFPRMSGQSLLKQRFDTRAQGGIAIHAISSNEGAQDEYGRFIRAAANSARAAKTPTKIFIQVQGHSSKRIDEGESSSEEEFWLGVLRQNPRNVHPYKRLAEIYLKRGDYPEARAALAYVVRHNPGDEEASRLLNDARKALAQKSVKTPA